MDPNLWAQADANPLTPEPWPKVRLGAAVDPNLWAQADANPLTPELWPQVRLGAAAVDLHLHAQADHDAQHQLGLAL